MVSAVIWYDIGNSSISGIGRRYFLINLTQLSLRAPWERWAPSKDRQQIGDEDEASGLCWYKVWLITRQIVLFEFCGGCYMYTRHWFRFLLTLSDSITSSNGIILQNVMRGNCDQLGHSSMGVLLVSVNWVRNILSILIFYISHITSTSVMKRCLILANWAWINMWHTTPHS